MDTTPERRLDAEGIPDLEGGRPGIDEETAEEGIFPPADHSIAAGSDPAYPVTAEEQRTPERGERRARREEPEVGEPPRRRPPGDEVEIRDDVPLLADPTDRGDDLDLGLVENEESGAGDLGDEGSPGPEEQAMHIRGDDEL